MFVRFRFLAVFAILATLFAFAVPSASAATPVSGSESCFLYGCNITVQLDEGVDYALVYNPVTNKTNFVLLRSKNDICDFETANGNYFAPSLYNSGPFQSGGEYYVRCRGEHKAFWSQFGD
jgi:hypothetical protein